MSTDLRWCYADTGRVVTKRLADHNERNRTCCIKLVTVCGFKASRKEIKSATELISSFLFYLPKNLANLLTILVKNDGLANFTISGAITVSLVVAYSVISIPRISALGLSSCCTISSDKDSMI